MLESELVFLTRLKQIRSGKYRYALGKHVGMGIILLGV